MNRTRKIKPLGWVGSLITFLIVASTIYVTHYVLVPAYVERTGHPYLVGYLWGWVANMATVFVASLVAYKLEGHPISWSAFSSRFRLDRMPAQDWLWTLAILAGVAGTYFALSFTAQWLAQIPLFAPHPAYPPDLGPEGVAGATPGQLFGMPLRGQWWVSIQHTFQPWNYLALWPGALFMAYVVQRRRNTWMGIIQHGLMNLGLFGYVLLGVSGWG